MAWVLKILQHSLSFVHKIWEILAWQKWNKTQLQDFTQTPAEREKVFQYNLLEQLEY